MTDQAFDGGALSGAPLDSPIEDARPLELVPPEGGTYQRVLKPLLDRMGGAVLSLATLPLALGVILLIWSTMGRPALFRQPRVGQHGAVFQVYKFRTMLPDRRNGSYGYNGPERRQRHKTTHDPRHTRVGRFLRRWSLDEIPQFWNVLLGHMSLVGPRPELVEIVETRYEPWQHRRHAVKPGITGLWQVSARSAEELMFERTDIDLHYVDNVTFTHDAKILLQTIPAALGLRKGS